MKNKCCNCINNTLCTYYEKKAKENEECKNRYALGDDEKAEMEIPNVVKYLPFTLKEIKK